MTKRRMCRTVRLSTDMVHGDRTNEKVVAKSRQKLSTTKVIVISIDALSAMKYVLASVPIKICILMNAISSPCSQSYLDYARNFVLGCIQQSSSPSGICFLILSKMVVYHWSRRLVVSKFLTSLVKASTSSSSMCRLRALCFDLSVSFSQVQEG